MGRVVIPSLRVEALTLRIDRRLDLASVVFEEDQRSGLGCCLRVKLFHDVTSLQFERTDQLLDSGEVLSCASNEPSQDDLGMYIVVNGSQGYLGSRLRSLTF